MLLKTPAQKMEIIQKIFLGVQEAVPETETLNELLLLCGNYEPEFRSIAYEAASFCLALNDLKAGDGLVSWRVFLQAQGGLHNTQIHVGLGWALAQEQKDVSVFLPALEPLMRYRVLDGYGYYEGTFRRRKSIMSQQQPELRDAVATGAYDQGLGRSFWYINHGNMDDAKLMLEKFPAERHKDLWRGLGIAIAYVGGCSETTLHEIFDKAGDHKTQLATGAVMALVSRHYAAYLSPDTELTCKVWCKQSTGELFALSDAIKSKLDLTAGNAYAEWVNGLEKMF